MAKARVKLNCTKCGQEFWAEKDCRNRAEADNWEAWMERTGGLCRDCWKAEQAEIREAEKLRKNAEEFAEAQKWEYSVGILPDLEGSDTQVAWATVIRHKIMGRAIGGPGLKPSFFRDGWEEMIKEGGYGVDTTNAIAYIRNWVFPLAEQKSAHWWIDNRETKGLDAEYTLSHWGDIYNASLAAAAKDEKIAEIKARRPERPECLKKAFAESPEKATWNNKVYGSAKYKNQRIYIADKEFSLTAQEAAELEAYATAWLAWRKELDEVKK